MKKLLSCLLAVILAFGFFCLLSSFDSTPEAQALSATSSRLYVAKNESAGLYGDVILISDSGSYTLYLPGSADPTKLFFTWGNDTTVLDSSGDPLVSGQAPVALPGASVTYNVNGGDRTIYTQQGSRDVRAMFLEVSDGLAGFDSFESMYDDDSKETKAAGTMTFGSDTGYYFSIKGRGNSTWIDSRGKKPYNITLYEDETYAKKQSTDLIAGVSAKSWSLLANEGDQSLLRNKLGYDLACALGIGLRSDFVDLYADGEYLGCYLMTPKNDYQAPDEGFVLEIDNYIDNEDPQFGLTGFNDYHPSMVGYQNRFTVKENNTTAATADIQSYMQQVWDALLDEDSDDYLQYIDLDSWAKFYLLHEFYKSFDVVCGSIFMYRDGMDAGDKLTAGPIWDLDNSMGRTNNNAELGLSTEQQHSPEGWYIQSVSDPQGRVPAFWLQQLGKHDSFMDRVQQLFLENEMLFLSAASMLDQSTDRLSASAQMNFDLHGFASSGISHVSSSSSCSCGCKATRSWGDCVDNLRNFATKRAGFLSANFRTSVTVRLQYDRATGGNTVVTLSGSYGMPYGQLPAPTKYGYTFGGWFTEPGGSGQQVTASTLITNSTDHSLYAHWIADATQPTTVPVTTVPATTVPVTTVPVTTVPITTVPGTIPTVPTTAVPDTTVPGTVPTVSPTTIPETTVSVPTVPATTVPGTIPVVPTIPGTNTSEPTAAAPTVPESTVPGTDVPTTPVPGTTVSGTAPSGTEAPQPSSPTHPQGDTRTSVGLVVGILTALLLAAGCGIFLFLKKRKQ